MREALIIGGAVLLTLLLIGRREEATPRAGAESVVIPRFVFTDILGAIQNRLGTETGEIL